VSASLRTLGRIIVAAYTLFFGPGFAAEPDAPNTPSQQKLKQLMEQVQARGAGGAGSASRAPATAEQAARMRERTALLALGEAALARSDADAAQQAFESAALIQHAADTEMGLVRTHMQQGQYRRALAFGAHTAGAHLDVVGGSALYAWLLHLGGQAAAAQKLLGEATARAPMQPLLAAVQKQLLADAPLASGLLLQTPVRMAPYGPRAGLPKGARVVGTGLLAGGGLMALVPERTLGKSTKVWVRNGLGQTAAAQIDRKFSDLGIVALRLHTALPVDDPLQLAPGDAFPGSVAYVVEYTPSLDATPQWPALHTGFLGSPLASHAARPLGITLSTGPRGGPVFDDGGRLVGMAIRKPGASDQLVLASSLLGRLGAALGTATTAAPKQRISVDQVYESALRSTLQIIVAQ
jgi:hypothetical protein